MTDNNTQSVGIAVNSFIATLGSKTHTSENLTALAQKISSGCDVNVEVKCYACIYTLPAQSELRIYFSSSHTTVTRIIDISETSSSEMKFKYMHN